VTGPVTAGRTPWVVGVSGASGTAYAAATLRGLLAAGRPVDLIVSQAARLTILDETGLAWRDDADSLLSWLRAPLDPGAAPHLVTTDVDVRHWAAGNLAGGPASGSYLTHGMIVVPASTAAVAGIALGLSKDLLQRSADVTLKERRPLIVVPRETPMTGSTLRHLVELDDAGAVVLPASPGFYAKPTTLQQLVDFVAGKTLDAAGVQHDLYSRWSGLAVRGPSSSRD
jgi:4-hydroxy-3-polyprenylbenzoate decarboxylase